MRSRARSSSPAPRCSGCATGSASSPKPSETGALAATADPAQDVYLVPAFVGLGAPWWNAEARGAIYGLTRGTTRRELARAALESVGFQTRDLIEAMHRDWAGSANTILRVDGGMAASDWTMQFLADILDAPRRPAAGDGDDGAGCRLSRRPRRRSPAGTGRLPPNPGYWSRRFTPHMDGETRDRRYDGWRAAVVRTMQAG